MIALLSLRGRLPLLPLVLAALFLLLSPPILSPALAGPDGQGEGEDGIAGDVAPPVLAPGAVIDAGNLDRLQFSSFAGHPLARLLAPPYQTLIRKDGLSLRLGDPLPFENDPRLVDLTARYAHQVTLDMAAAPSATPPAISGGSPALRPQGVKGFVAGIPFPRLSLDDPLCGFKIAYNIVYSAYLGDTLFWPSQVFVMVGPGGYKRSLVYRYAYYHMVGRRDGAAAPRTEGDGSIRSLTTMIAMEPFDVRGIGTFSVRYVDGRMDDIFTYLRAVRRWRRLSGGAWFDPVQGSDILLDEATYGFNADPAWYDGFRVLGREVMLFPESGQNAYFNDSGQDLLNRFPFMKLTTAPYWNTRDPREVWRPRTVYVVEAIPPDHHPMGRRILYVDTNIYLPVIYYAEGFDRRRALWHVYTQVPNRITGADGHPTLNPVFGRVIDVMNRSATLLPAGPDRLVNPPGVSHEDFNMAAVTRLLQ